jgi:hypothetical protein
MQRLVASGQCPVGDERAAKMFDRLAWAQRVERLVVERDASVKDVAKDAVRGAALDPAHRRAWVRGLGQALEIGAQPRKRLGSGAVDVRLERGDDRATRAEPSRVKVILLCAARANVRAADAGARLTQPLQPGDARESSALVAVSAGAALLQIAATAV